MSIWVLLGWGWLGMAVLMAGLWYGQWRSRNAGIVDVAWAAGVAVLAVGYAVAGEAGDPARRLLIAVMAGLWGLRLAGYLARRVSAEAEDGRYRALREAWGKRTQPYMFLFFQIQALWAVMFSLPILIAARNPAPGPAWYDWLGVAIWVLALGGESLADRQLARFRRDPANRGGVCQQGLWRYSRHPNYFFEWLHWWAYVAMGLAGPFGWVTLAGPAVMLFFLLKVTGVPPTEARALESRGEAYRAYQRTTNAFFPGPPRPQSGGENR
ncbi:DUF1295 domain-containing protein [Thiohalorhabdus sp.]|uniref:DUF1295 domain-containing protein n=1 Tax=Thiohalorhabdus sp. TaxID=3094134 RepID=UPI002FC2B9E2